MNTKQLQLVTFEQAKKLKALGFDLEVVHNYYPDGELHTASEMDNYNNEDWVISNTKENVISAPAVALALKWFRDEKKLKNAVCLCRWSNTTDGSVRDVYQPSIRGKLRFEYDTYEAAESALLDELLTVFEEEKQQ